VVGRSADAVTQPGAETGQRTYCPVSGVVFQVKATGARREVEGKTVHFCCDGCAGFFDRNREKVIALRGLSSS
jgi:hypothetical protein